MTQWSGTEDRLKNGCRGKLLKISQLSCLMIPGVAPLHAAHSMPEILRFDEFELDKTAFELRRAGRAVRVERIPLELLFYLSERPRQLVTREEILNRIWGKDVFVDADNAINTAIRKIRRALRDDAEQPRYVITVPGKGYRFTADISSPAVATPATAESGAARLSATADASSSVWPRSATASAGLNWRRLTVGLGVVLAAIALGAFSVRWMISRLTSASSVVRLEDLEIVQLTTSGTAERPAISPDGTYVAYIQHKGEAFSLRMRQIETGSDIEIVPPSAEVTLEGLSFTPDGAFVDIVGRDLTHVRRLRRVPFLGGAPRRLVDAIDSPVGWAPDGRHMAFVRGSLGHGRTVVVVADPHGANERELVSRQTPAAFISFGLAGTPPNPPAWSPDGRSIAVLGQTGSGSSSFVRELVILQVSNASARTLTIPESAFNRGVAWLDANSLIIDHRAGPGAASQLWRVAASDGRLMRLSNDLTDYDGFSLTADRRVLATGRRETRAGVWTGNGNGTEMIENIPLAPFGALLVGAVVTWAGDRLLYTATNAGDTDIMTMVPGRDVPQELIAHAGSPSATSDGQTIVFQRSGLWKVDGEGRSPVRLKADGFVPMLTPDGRYLVYLSQQNGILSPWVAPIEGGGATQIVNAVVASVLSVDVSPDSRSVVLSTLGERGQRLLISCSLPACATRRTLLLPFGGVGRIRWTADGAHVAFLDAAKSSVWIQPLDGGAPRQITHFDDGRTITDFAWSRDGKRLALARAATTSDIVLFKGLLR
jgi:DNA-binding winged helix-turn-helix (wHTH) protein/Tol biopolymer transport system component